MLGKTLHDMMIQELRATFDREARGEVLAQTSRLLDHKLRDLITEHGIGYHHVSADL